MRANKPIFKAISGALDRRMCARMSIVRGIDSQVNVTGAMPPTTSTTEGTHMTIERKNKDIDDRWFTSFWGANCDLGVVDKLAAPEWTE